MRILCYDCFSGISGDMNLGAMIDLGIDKNYLTGELNKLGLKGWELIAEQDNRHGIMGTRVTVRQTAEEHVHRHLADIEKIFMGSTLSDKVKKLALDIFMKIAAAESRVHGVGIEEVHFHEVGAIDSIIDIAGASICFNALDVDAVHVSEIQLGSGFVDSGHGKLPVPAPATVEIIRGLPVRKGGVNFEATTPTGAAILATIGTEFGTDIEVKIEKTGYGIGHKDDPGIPNLLRVSLGEKADTQNQGHEAYLIESNIDDMNPEFYEYISERLFKAGASDVFYSNVIMKKGRPGIVLRVICEAGVSGRIKEIIFAESTTLGIRTSAFRKDTLAREFRKLDTLYGEVTVKHSFYNGREVSAKPEFEDCRRIASEKGLPVKEVYNYIMSLVIKSKD